jgi:putative acetyltransferase
VVDQLPGLTVAPAAARDPEVSQLLDALTAELAASEYTAEQTFGYSLEQLEQSNVHLVAARVLDRVVGVGGVELQDHGLAELKRSFVAAGERGNGVADAIMAALVEHARVNGVQVLRLETGDQQFAAQAFYRRHGFVGVPRFSPYEFSDTSVCMQRTIEQ